MSNRATRTCSVIAVLSTICLLPSFSVQGRAAKNGVKPKTKAQASAPAIKIQNTKTFFSWYIRKGEIEKSEFETEQQYRKRLPWFDPQKTIYFRLDSTHYDDAYKWADALCNQNPWMYAYNADSQELTVIGGEYGDISLYQPEKLAAQTPIVVLQDTDDLGSYTGTNAFGVTAKVHEYQHNTYVLNICNIGECPDTVYDLGHNRFRITVELAPQEARKLCSRLQIVLGLRLAGHQASESLMTYAGKPTIDHPFDSCSYDHIIDARLVKVLLMDRASGKVFTEDTIGN